MRAPCLTGVAIAAALIAGCGGGGGGEDASGGCLAEWNGDDVALTVGSHAYDAHGVRRALVEPTAAPEAENVRTAETCIVVFAVEEGDREYGRLGLVVTRFGWSELFELGLSDRELADLQRSASVEANAVLLPDGKLSAD